MGNDLHGELIVEWNFVFILLECIIINKGTTTLEPCHCLRFVIAKLDAVCAVLDLEVEHLICASLFRDPLRRKAFLIIISLVQHSFWCLG